MYPGSVALKAPGIATLGPRFVDPPPVTVICAHSMKNCGIPAGHGLWMARDWMRRR